ncbi:MAG: hypothetical protein IPK60_00035 [Sandaracinaceae bacterium]|nr:hypothetical protein [Sandaracinaceae bacterium]
MRRRILVKKFQSWEQAEQADDEFWQAITPEKRACALEQIRAEHAAWSGRRQPRFSRTLRIKRASR